MYERDYHEGNGPRKREREIAREGENDRGLGKEQNARLELLDEARLGWRRRRWRTKPGRVRYYLLIHLRLCGKAATEKFARGDNDRPLRVGLMGKKLGSSITGVNDALRLYVGDPGDVVLVWYMS